MHLSCLFLCACLLALPLSANAQVKLPKPPNIVKFEQRAAIDNGSTECKVKFPKTSDFGAANSRVLWCKTNIPTG